MIALGLDISEEGASTAEIIKSTGLKNGTVYPAVRQLFNDKILEQTKDKKYLVPNYATEKIKSIICEAQ